jgi:hypothetical protein
MNMGGSKGKDGFKDEKSDNYYNIDERRGDW